MYKNQQDDITGYSKQERHHLDKLVEHMQTKKPSYRYLLKPSNPTKMCPYDAFLYIYNEKNELIKRLIVEVKVRSSEYDSYFLEDMKLTSLRKIQKYYSNFEIWYVNFNPTNTIIYPLDYISLPEPEMRYMNKATYKSRTDKTEKLVYDIPISLGKTSSYLYTDFPYKRTKS